MSNLSIAPIRPWFTTLSGWSTAQLAELLALGELDRRAGRLVGRQYAIRRDALLAELANRAA